MNPTRIDKRGAQAVGERIRELRESCDMRQEELSDNLKMAQQQLSKIERGTGNLPAHLMPLLCNLLRTTPNIFFYHFESPHNSSGKLDDDVISIAVAIQNVPLNFRIPLMSLIGELAARQSRKSKSETPTGGDT